MIFTYNLKSQKVHLPKITKFSEHNLLERRDLEKWILEYSEILGEDLLVISTEFDQFDKTSERPDILALDKQGNLVVIELKRDDSGKSVELQAIKYAAYISTMTLEETAELLKSYRLKQNKQISSEDAKEELKQFTDNNLEELDDKPRIILVAKEFQPEVTATVLWLRTFGIDITCIRLTPYKNSDESITFESSVLIPLPEAEDYLIKVEKKENIQRQINATGQQYLVFHTKLFNLLVNRISLPLPVPNGRSYQTISTGLGGVHYEWLFRSRSHELGVELHFEKADGRFNTKVFNQLKPYISQFEKKVNSQVFIDSSWQKAGIRFGVVHDVTDFSDQSLLEWAADTMVALIDTFQPQISELK